MTVPASPQSTSAGNAAVPPRSPPWAPIRTVSRSVTTGTPSAVSAPVISAVSRVGGAPST